MIVKAAAGTIVIAAAVRRASISTCFGCRSTSTAHTAHAQLVGFGVLAGNAEGEIYSHARVV